MFDPTRWPLLRWKFNSTFGHDLHSLTQRRIFANYISEDLLIAVISIDIGVVKRSHSDVERLPYQSFHLGHVKIPSPCTGYDPGKFRTFLVNFFAFHFMLMILTSG